jgi:hypothetical protein
VCYFQLAFSKIFTEHIVDVDVRLALKTVRLGNMAQLLRFIDPFRRSRSTGLRGKLCHKNDRVTDLRGEMSSHPVHRRNKGTEYYCIKWPLPASL